MGGIVCDMLSATCGQLSQPTNLHSLSLSLSLTLPLSLSLPPLPSPSLLLVHTGMLPPPCWHHAVGLHQAGIVDECL